jgi:hypothetical protein
LVKVYGHPRSGCNFAVNFIASAFYPETAAQMTMAWTGHWSKRVRVLTNARSLWGNHGIYQGQTNCIYVIRDVRDVALSMHRTKQFQHESWHELDFSAFIRKPLDWYETPGCRAAKGLNIIEHWCMHVGSWMGGEGVLFLHYEDLVKNPLCMVNVIEELFTECVCVSVPDMSLVGPFPGNVGTQKWKGVISQRDLDYISRIVKGGKIPCHS